MEPYLSYCPSSSPPLQQALSKQRQKGGDDDHHQFIQNATSFLGLTAENKSLSPGVEVKEMERPKIGLTNKMTRKKPNYAFQTRSHVDDGYFRRKFGQKAVKNNKLPRMPLTQRIVPSKNSPPPTSRRAINIVIGVSVGLGLLLIAFIVWFVWHKLKHRRHHLAAAQVEVQHGAQELPVPEVRIDAQELAAELQIDAQEYAVGVDSSESE